MVVRVSVALAFALLALASGSSGSTPVVAHGVVSYSIVKEGIPPTCAGDGPFTFTFESTTRNVVIAGTAVGCVPIWARFSNCATLPDTTIICDKTQGGNRILVTLAPDGAFDYLWDAPDFHEEMHGTLAQVA